jgi:hypothetical protein
MLNKKGLGNDYKIQNSKVELKLKKAIDIRHKI